MSFLGAFLGGMGQAAQQRNLMNATIQAHANEENAKVLEHLAENARDEKSRNELLIGAARTRAQGSHKPKKEDSIDQLIARQVADQYQLGGQAPPQQGQPSQPGQQAPQGSPQQSASPTAPAASPTLPAPPTEVPNAAPKLDVATALPTPESQSVIDPNQGPPSMRFGPTSAFTDANGALFSTPHVDTAALQSQGSQPPQTALPSAPPFPPPAPTLAVLPSPPSGQPNMPGGGYSDAGTPNAVAGGAPPSAGYGGPVVDPRMPRTAQSQDTSSSPSSPSSALLGGGPPDIASDADQKAYQAVSRRDHKSHWYKSNLLTPDESAGRHSKHTGWEDDAKYRSFNHWQVEGKKELDAYHQEQSKAQIEQLKADGVWDRLTPVQQAQVKMGDKITAASSRLQAPHKLAGVVQGKDIAGETDIFGHPVDPAGSYRAEQNLGDNTFRFVPTQPMTTGVNTIDDSGNFTRTMVDRNGHTVGTVNNVVPPSGYATSNTSASKVVMVQQTDGSTAPVRVNTSSTTSKSVPGQAGKSLAAPPSSGPMPNSAPKLSGGGSAGARSSSSGGGSTQPGTALSGRGVSVSMPGKAVGGKSFAPKEVIDQNTQVGQLDNTIRLVKEIQPRLPLLANAFTAKKIQMQTDPKTGFLKAVLNRSMPLSKDEIILAQDLQSMAEHINTIRGPLGATGFRGADAFANLLAQGGNAMQDPRITAGVMNTTLRALNTQRGIKATVLQQHNQLLQPPPQSGDTGGGGSDMINVQIPGYPAGHIHASQKAQFLKDHPNAKVM